MEMQPRHIAVLGLDDFFGCGEARAGFAQLVAHRVVLILVRAQFVGKRRFNQSLSLGRRQVPSHAGSRLSLDWKSPGKQEKDS